MKRLLISLIAICVFSFLFVSCHKNSQRYTFEKSSDNKIEIKISRFDKDLVKMDTKNGLNSVKGLYRKYPEFMSAFINNVLEVDERDTIKVADHLLRFVSDTAFYKINEKTLQTFDDVTDIEKDLSGAFTYVHQYFPDMKIPTIYFFVSGFNRAVLMTDDFVGVGVDFYLGADYAPYKEFTYDYLLYNMRRDMLSIDVVSASLFRYFSFDGNQNRLIDNMLYRGKIIYLAASVMPDKKMDDVIGYSPDQMKWAQEYESEVWKAIVGQKDLFSTNVKLIGKYLNDAPFTTPISQESPGRLGIYIGFKIVESYMQKNKNVSIQDLMKMTDYQQMLQNSGYQP